MSFPAPYVLLRMAGLPFEELFALRFETTVALLHERRALEDWFAARREQLSAMLYDAAPKIADLKIRRHLLDLRRAIFNDRLPKHGLRLLRILRAHLDRPTRTAILQWYRRISRHSRFEARLTETFSAELCTKRVALRQLLASDDFLKGVQLSTTGFYDALKKWLSAPQRDSSSTEHLETSAMLYLSRMAAKPTPFGTFTPTAFGTFAHLTTHATAIRPHTALAIDRPSRSRIRFNGSLVQLLAREISRIRDVSTALPLRVRDGFWVTSSEVCFLRPHYELQPFFHRTDVVARIPRTPALQWLITRLSRERTLSRAEVLDALDEWSDPAMTSQWLEGLIETGVLVNQIELDVHAGDLLPELIEALEAIEDPAIAQCREELLRIDGAVAGFATSGHKARRELLERMKMSVARIADLLALDAKALASFDLVREDAGVPATNFALGPEVERSLQQSLAPVLEAFQLGHVQHTPELIRQFIDIGGGKPIHPLAFLTYYSRAQGEVLSRRGDDGLRAVAPVMFETEQQLERLTAAALRSAQLSGDDIVELDLGSPKPVPSLRGWPSSVTAFVQLAAESAEAIDRGDFLVVLNRTYSGLGTYAARYCGLYDDGVHGDPLTDAMRDQFLRLGDRAELVELSLLTDVSDVQLHPALSARTLGWPGDVSRQSLTFSDVVLSYDAVADAMRLLERSTGKELLPLYLGAIQPLAIPQPLPTVINALTPASYPFSRDFWRHLRPEAITDDAQVPDVVRLPRVQFGKLVVARACWRVASSAVPLPSRGESDAFYFGRLHRWREAIGMPDLVFVRPDLDAPTAALTRRHKPMLLDFRNPWIAQSLSRVVVEATGQLFFVEMLPGPHQLPVTRHGRRVVSEFQIEWNWKETQA